MGNGLDGADIAPLQPYRGLFALHYNPYGAVLFQRSVLHPVVVDYQVLEICAGKAPLRSLCLVHFVQLA